MIRAWIVVFDNGYCVFSTAAEAMSFLNDPMFDYCEYVVACPV